MTAPLFLVSMATIAALSGFLIRRILVALMLVLLSPSSRKLVPVLLFIVFSSRIPKLRWVVVDVRPVFPLLGTIPTVLFRMALFGPGSCPAAIAQLVPTELTMTIEFRVLPSVLSCLCMGLGTRLRLLLSTITGHKYSKWRV